MAIRTDKSIGTRKYDWANGDVVATSGTSAQSPAFSANELLICATEDCWITVGSDPTAVANTDDNLFLPKKVMFHLQVKPGLKIAAIQNDTGGYLSILPVS